MSASVSVGDVDFKLIRALDNLGAVLGGDGVVDLGGEALGVHHEHIEFLDVADDEFAEAACEDVSGLFVGAVTNGGHDEGAAVASAHAVIDTTGLPP